ncbi:Mu transposase C-terminal domain-containing protein [Nonomuraea sp. NPDC049758]|uniref:Mu transposase C-terminal domain-containing protein n=1 Tax=Nonomuraea sp. NPDC049758 TaxID=3154360 RepID=UPI003430A454
MARADRDQQQAALARLMALKSAGQLRTEHVRLAAQGLGLSERTVWRRLEQGLPTPSQYQLSDTDREAFAYYRGNIAVVHRARAATLSAQDTMGASVPEFLASGWAQSTPVSLRTLQRAFRRELTPAQLAAWRWGEEGRRAATVYLTRGPSHRNEMWEMDHKALPILVLPPRGPAVCPWLTSVIDDGTRSLLGWAIALSPHTGTVLTALRMALVYDPARGPYGAVPAGYRIDRGLEFAATAVRDVFAALCVTSHRLPGYQPHRKGKIERLHRTIDQTLLCTLPGFTEGPRDAAGKLYGPLDDRAAARAAAGERGAGPGAGVAPMRIERFAARFADWAAWYNFERPHRMLDGRTPLQAWQDDPSALHRIDAADLRHLLLASDERTIGKDGIHFRTFAYVAPELQGRGGQKVVVRYMPHDDRSIEVYLDGAHLCTAYPADRLTPEQQEAFRAHARAEAKELGRQRRRAAQRARVELAPLTGAGPAEQSRLTPAGTPAPRTARSRDEALARKARVDLLGLPSRRTPPPAPPDPAE